MQKLRQNVDGVTARARVVPVRAVAVRAAAVHHRANRISGMNGIVAGTVDHRRHRPIKQLNKSLLHFLEGVARGPYTSRTYFVIYWSMHYSLNQSSKIGIVVFFSFFLFYW